MEPVEIDGWWYPVDNHVTRRNGPGSRYGLVKPYLSKFGCALDCGAYVGGWTKDLLKNFEHVFAVEMDPLNAECIKKNCPDASVICKALSDGFAEVKYHGDEYPESPIYCVGKGEKSQQSITIDSLGLNPNFIKLDLQGYETFALKGAVETLKRSKPTLFFEHEHKCSTRYGLDGSELPAFLEDLGATRIKKWGPDQLWMWED